jgi:hypothetical protein
MAAGEAVAVGRAWGEQIDARVARALCGESLSLSRSQLAVLLATDPAEARARLAHVPFYWERR